MAPDIRSLVSNGETKELRSRLYHCIKNGFDDVVFCDPVRGINGATPAKIFHVWQHGLSPRALCALFGQKRALKLASRRPRKKKPAAKIILPEEGDDENDGFLNGSEDPNAESDEEELDKEDFEEEVVDAEGQEGMGARSDSERARVANL